VFTGVLAPVLVHVVTDGLKGSGLTPPTAEPPSWADPRPHAPASPPDPGPVPVVAQGVGRTPEQAFGDALRGALLRAAATLVDAGTWARDGRRIAAAVPPDGAGVVTRCRDLGCWRVREQGQDLYRSRVEVFVARGPLADRPRAAGARVLGWDAAP
jgi:hypothetical protein